jgi:hypothetical protein
MADHYANRLANIGLNDDGSAIAVMVACTNHGTSYGRKHDLPRTCGVVGTQVKVRGARSTVGARIQESA